MDILDSPVITPACGRQALFCFNQYGDCLKVKLRPGNVHSADGCLEFVEPILRYYVGKGFKVKIRCDAAFAIPELFELCETLGVEYVVRIKSNSRLEELVADLTGTIKKDNQKVVTLYKDFSYQAASWDEARSLPAAGRDYCKNRAVSGRVISAGWIYRNQSEMV